MPDLYDVAAIGNAIVDVITPSSDDFLIEQDLPKGGMTLIDDARAEALYDAMGPGVETSGGSAANTVAGVASFGGRAAFIGKVADDQLGKVFGHDIRALGAHFDTPPLKFVKQYAGLAAEIRKAVAAYSEDVRSGKFPDEAHTFHVDK